MTNLTLIVNHDKDPGNEALEYLMEHYHDFDPAEWEAQYEELTEIAILEDKIRARRREQMKRRTAALLPKQS